jgi:hypothetical protein
MGRIMDQISEREPRPEEEIYGFYAALIDEEESSRFYSSFKGLFDNEHFIPENRKSDFIATRFVFCPGYLRMYDAFGDNFKESMGRLVEILKQENEQVIKKVHDEKEKDYHKMLLPIEVLLNEEADDSSFYMGCDSEFVEKLRIIGAKNSKVEIEFGGNEINDIICVLYAGNKPLMTYCITPAEELKKEIRLWPGIEQRIYQISATNGQLDGLEKAFAYMQMLGEVGHSTSICLGWNGKEPIKFRRLERAESDGGRVYKVVANIEFLDYLEKSMFSFEKLSSGERKRQIEIGIDGDGSDRPFFERANGNPLSMPLEHLVLALEFGKDKKILTPEEFLDCVKKNKEAKDKKDKVDVYYDFKEDDDGEFFLIE